MLNHPTNISASLATKAWGAASTRLSARYSLFTAVLALALCAVPADLLAVTYTVNALTDNAPTTGGVGTAATLSGDLRWCLTRANNLADTGPYAVTFAHGLTGKITLGGHELIIKRSLTLTGPGANKLTLDANSASRHFYIAPGITVTFSGFTLTHGNGAGNDVTNTDTTYGGDGGAIFNDGSVLTVTDCSVSNNGIGTSNAGGGAGIYSRARYVDASLTLTNCTINGNVGNDGGGGVQNNAFGGIATLNITNCDISNNNPNWDAGGILNYALGGGAAADATISNCTITGNTALYLGGGGVGNTSDEGGIATMSITNCVVSGNSVTGGGNTGGGIRNAGKMSITDSTISGNTGPATGGGISNSEQLTVSGCTINGNTASQSGGGVYNGDGNGILSLNNTTICDNSAQTSGGGIYNYNDTYTNTPSVTIANCTICGNAAISGGGGAGIYNVGTTSGPYTYYAAVMVSNTILALNPPNVNDPGANYNSLLGTFVSGGFNLADDHTCDTVFTGTGDQKDTPAGLQVNGNGIPLLQKNGGPTQTVALSVGSAAINAGKTATDPLTSLPATSDQRGFPRPVGMPSVPGGDGSDIGAFEAASGPSVNVSAFPSTDGTVNGGGIHASGTSTSVMETPNAGYIFVNWTEGSTVVSKSPSYTFTATTNRTLVANFRPIMPPTIVVKAVGGAVLVSGTGIHDFASVVSGGKAAATFTVQNPGDSDLTLGAISVDGTNPADFTVTGKPKTPVGSDSSTMFTVTFAPGGLGNRSAALHLSSNDAVTPSFEIDLSGTGIPPIESFKGHYDGLVVYNDGLLSGTANGYLTISLTGTGSFTGAVKLAGLGYSFRGAFGEDGTTNVSIKRAGATPITLVLTLNGTTANNLSASISADGSTYAVNAGAPEQYTTVNPAPSAGYYTVMLPAPASPTGAAAMATAIVTGGKITGLDVTEGGSGYVTPPRVVITGQPGSGAVATAVISGGSVASITPEKSGARYPETGTTVTIDPPSAGLPQGTGWATMGISQSGTVALVGKLGDGTAFSAGGLVSQGPSNDTVSLYTSLYSGTSKSNAPGSILGTITFEPLSGSDCDGLLAWFKPVQTTGARYKSGFDTSVEFMAARYAPPHLSQVLSFTNPAAGTASFELDLGNLASPIVDTLSISNRNRATVQSPNLDQLHFHVSATTGIFGGTVIAEAESPGAISGVIYQKTNVGAGLFLGSSQTGNAALAPQ